MSVKSVLYQPNSAIAGDSSNGPSVTLWGADGTPNAWIEDFLQSPWLGNYFYETFVCAPNFTATSGGAVVGSYGQWSLYAGKTSALTDAKIIGGGITLTPGTSASNEPMALTSSAGAFQITSGSSTGLQGRLAFECRVALQSVTASMRDAFVGLCDQGAPNVAVPLTAGTGTNQLCTSNNLIGFYNAYSGGAQDWGFVFQLASTAPVFVTNLQSLISQITGSAIVAGTYYKLGFDFNPNAPVQAVPSTAGTGQTAGTLARAMLKVFVNGQAAATFLTQAANIFTASFPTGVMGPAIAICNEVSSTGASTNAGSLSIDWVRVGQTALV